MRNALIVAAALLAVPAAAQDLPPVAGQTLEVTLTGEGEAEQEAQAFELTAMFFGYGAEGSTRHDARAAIEAVDEWDMPYRTTCLSASQFGFLGNERPAVGFVEEEVDAAVAAAEDEEWTAASPLYFYGQFADADSLRRASDRLQQGGLQILSTMAVAFDCRQAEHAARSAALADAYAQASLLADELGMRVAGMTSVDFTSADENERLLTAMLGVRREEDSLVAQERAKVVFTFERRVAN